MPRVDFNLELLLETTEEYADLCPQEDFVEWYSRPRNIMFTEGRDVGLASFEYPGVFSVHWYFKDARGRKAIELGQKMCGLLFENHGAEVLRGFIKTRLKASRWAVRQLGFKSYGFMVFPDGEENELFCLTKDEYLDKKENNQWAQ